MKKIILIDDDKGIRDTTVDILELAGYQIYTSSNGKTGIQLIKTEKPDIILCDINMPELDGYEVLRILNRIPETNNIPFIFLSSNANNSDIRKGMNLGADDYLTKPFKEIDLLDAIETRISRSKKMNQKFNNGIDGYNSFVDLANGIDAFDKLSNPTRRKTYLKNEIIFRENDHVNFIYYVVKGSVKRIETDSHGKEFLDDIHKKGDFFGYLSMFNGTENQQHRRTAIVLEPTEIALILKKDFKKLIHNNREVAANFIKILSGNILDKEERLLKLAYASVRERVASVLLKFHEKENEAFKISRDNLANLVGTSKESLIRTLTDFKKEHIISTGRAEIMILHKKGLEKIADGF